MLKQDIQKLIIDIHSQNVGMGWWDKPREPGTLLMLVVSEIAEAMEGDRKDLMDDHLPRRKMVEVELADAVIRILDFCGYYELYPTLDNPDLILCCQRDMDAAGNENGSKLFSIVRWIVELSFMVYASCEKRQYDEKRAQQIISGFIIQIESFCKENGFDLWGAVDEKRAYNQRRPDHKRENRALEGGKKY